MSENVRKVVDWIERRTGVETAVKNFLYEDIPASSGWHQVLGSVAVFLFLLQAFTGILLAFNYAPTPGEAYNSLQYILAEVTGGRLIRGLHHWGASMMLVVVVLHMTQVFLWGAYKKPREATWMAGVLLLLVSLGFGLTGYLLPWDDRAYWGTVVTTQIAAKAPLAGPYLSRLLGTSGDTIGVITFARFFAAHVLLLPPLMMLLLSLHIYLVRKHGVTPAPDDNGPSKKFFPDQVFKDTVAIFVCFVVLILVAALLDAPLEQLADPTDTSYTPRPDWYFLWLFQTLKFFEGPLEVVGSMVLPGLGVLALLLVPFIDRGQLRKVTRRTTAIGVACLAAAVWASLTMAAMKSAPGGAVSEQAAAVETWQQLSPEELSGVAYYRRESCSSCHGARAGKVGPDLAKTAPRKSAAWMIEHFKQPSAVKPGSRMPPIQLADAQLNALAAFLMKLTPANAGVLETAPEFAVEGALVYQKSNCGACHQVNGMGMRLGPELNGLAKRRTREWVEQHFAAPRKLSPGSIMPAYPFTAKELEVVTSYLLALPVR